MLIEILYCNEYNISVLTEYPDALPGGNFQLLTTEGIVLMFFQFKIAEVTFVLSFINSQCSAKKKYKFLHGKYF